MKVLHVLVNVHVYRVVSLRVCESVFYEVPRGPSEWSVQNVQVVT